MSDRVAIIGNGNSWLARSLAATLGASTAERRSVKSLPGWVKDLVPKPSGKNETVKNGNEDVEADTMPLIISKVHRTLWHTQKLAPRLKGNSLAETCRNDWQFIFDYILYRKDAKGKEQVRSPRRMIHEGKGDCDCFTTTLSSLLTNQGIPHYLRIMKEGGNDFWSHIYIVVPKSGKLSKSGVSNRSEYIVMDCVTNRFDYEPTFSEKKDFPMALEFLDGIGSAGKGSLSGSECKPRKYSYYVRSGQFRERGLVVTEELLAKAKIPVVPSTTPNGDFGYAVHTPAGVKHVPPVITPAQAGELLMLMASTDASSTSPTGGNKPVKNKTSWGWVALVGGLGLVLLLSTDSKTTTKRTEQLAGPSQKAKTKKRTLKL